MKKATIESPAIETIEVNGKPCLVLVPELVNELAVVDLNVIKRLASFLPKASVNQIKSDFKDRMDGCNSLEMYVEALRNELSFHETVNLITTVKIEAKQEVEQSVQPWDRVKAVE